MAGTEEEMMLRVAVLLLVPFFALLLQHGPGEFVLKQGGV